MEPDCFGLKGSEAFFFSSSTSLFVVSGVLVLERVGCVCLPSFRDWGGIF